jgi:dolichol-phosphate mannosyltransferase
MSVVCSVIVPVFNEEEVINETYKRLTEVMQSTGESYEIIFVNDGSRDKTALMAREICMKDANVKLIDFSRNFGHQTAITAGMDHACGDAVVVIDADLQDPPEVILEMLKKWREGYEIVYGQRIKREGETVFKKLTAKIFYRFLRSMTEVDIPVDTGDFRLIDRKVCDAMKTISERNRYVRGIVSWLGFKSAPVEFERKKRFAGTTKYPLKKMIKFASDAIMSFSYKPLKIATFFGVFVSVVSFVALIAMIILKLCGIGEYVDGWTSLAVISLFLNGIVLMILGIIGEYIGRIYDEAKDRPLYVIREVVNFTEENVK